MFSLSVVCTFENSDIYYSDDNLIPFCWCTILKKIVSQVSSEGYGCYKPGELKNNDCVPHRSDRSLFNFPRAAHARSRSGYQQSKSGFQEKKLVSWTFSAHNTGRLFPVWSWDVTAQSTMYMYVQEIKGFILELNRWIKAAGKKEILKIPQNTVYSRPVIHSKVNVVITIQKFKRAIPLWVFIHVNLWSGEWQPFFPQGLVFSSWSLLTLWWQTAEIVYRVFISFRNIVNWL